MTWYYTAILDRAITGPEQGFPCVVFPHSEKPVFITGFPGDENRFLPVRKTIQGKPCFHYRDGFAVYSKSHWWFTITIYEYYRIFVKLHYIFSFGKRKRGLVSICFYLLGIFTFTLYEYCRIFDKLHCIITWCCLNNLQNIVWLSVSIFIVYWQFYSILNPLYPLNKRDHTYMYTCASDQTCLHTLVLYVI